LTPLRSTDPGVPRRAPFAAPGLVFDAEAVWTLFEGRTDRMKQVWQITRTVLPANLDGLAAAVAIADWPAAARHAHSITGSASNFGAQALVATTRKIEDGAGRGDVPAGDVREAQAQFDTLCAAMSSWLECVSAVPGPLASGTEDPSGQ